MERFFADDYATTIANLSRLGAALDLAQPHENFLERGARLKVFDEIVGHLTPFTLNSLGLMDRVKRVRQVLADEPLDIIRAGIMVHELDRDLTVEVYTGRFLMLRGVEASLYAMGADGGAQPLGMVVELRFPKAKDDIASAARCLALNEWVAAVFHLMGVLQVALHDLASELSVEMKHEIELENWGNIIEAIEKEIAKIEQEGRTSDRAERQQYYNGLASQFRYFKDAWRNHVAHTRVNYNERQARIVWDHVKDFLQDMATRGVPL